MIFDSLVSLTESFSTALVAGYDTATMANTAGRAFNSASAKKRKEASIFAPVIAPQKMNLMDLMFG